MRWPNIGLVDGELFGLGARVKVAGLGRGRLLEGFKWMDGENRELLNELRQLNLKAVEIRGEMHIVESANVRECP